MGTKAKLSLWTQLGDACGPQLLLWAPLGCHRGLWRAVIREVSGAAEWPWPAWHPDTWAHHAALPSGVTSDCYSFHPAFCLVAKRRPWEKVFYFHRSIGRRCLLLWLQVMIWINTHTLANVSSVALTLSSCPVGLPINWALLSGIPFWGNAREPTGRPGAPPPFIPSFLFPTGNASPCRTKHLSHPFTLTPQRGQVWNTAHALGKEEWEGRKKETLHGRRKNISNRRVYDYAISPEQWSNSALQWGNDKKVFYRWGGLPLASFLQRVWGLHSASTAQPSCQTFSFSGITWAHIRVSTCTRKSIFVVCRIESPLGFLSFPFSWIVQTLSSSCDRVSISRPNHVKRMKKNYVFFSGVYEVWNCTKPL